MTIDIPPVVERFLRAEHDGDFAALAACFTPEGVVLDEGRTRVGRQAIIAWREEVAAGPAYTAEVGSHDRLGPDAFRLVQHLEGDFAGGVADLAFTFALTDDAIAALMILRHDG
jgi:hypothetical protein